MEGLTDETLLAGLASGNPDDAAAFVRRFQSRVYGLALTIVRDPDVADDVAQETFVRAWRHAATYDVRRGRVPAWLLTIARNLAIDRVRMRGATPTDPEVIASELDISTQGSLPDVAERDRVRRAMSALPDDQRRALVLPVYAGRTAQGVSALTGDPQRAAK